MEDFILKVKCPNDGSECSVVGGDIMESLGLLGDNEQNMQCLACGYASNSNMKTHIQPFPKDFKGMILSAIKDRNPVVILEHRWLHNIKGDVPKKYYLNILIQ